MDLFQWRVAITITFSAWALTLVYVAYIVVPVIIGWERRTRAKDRRVLIFFGVHLLFAIVIGILIGARP